MKIHRVEEFEDWLNEQTHTIQTRVEFRLDFIACGHWGNFKLFEGLIEFRWVNGLRLYGFRFGHDIIIIAIGGTKHGQKFDIKKAKKIKEAFDNGTRTLHF